MNLSTLRAYQACASPLKDVATSHIEKMVLSIRIQAMLEESGFHDLARQVSEKINYPSFHPSFRRRYLEIAGLFDLLQPEQNSSEASNDGAKN